MDAMLIFIALTLVIGLLSITCILKECPKKLSDYILWYGLGMPLGIGITSLLLFVLFLFNLQSYVIYADSAVAIILVPCHACNVG